MKKKIILKGPLLTRSGYGEQARFALRALRSRPDLFDIYIQPLTWGTTSWLNEMSEERTWIDKIIEKTIGYIQQGGSFDMSLQTTIPNEWEKHAPVNIGYTAGIETTKVAHEWIQKGNEMDKIVVVSNHSKNVFNNTTYQAVHQQTRQEVTLQLNTAIDVVNYPVKTFSNLEDLDLDLEYDFNFLMVAQYGPRKNLAHAVNWFIEEFHDDEVGLVFKSNISKNCHMDRQQLLGDLTGHIKNTFPNKKCKIYLLHGDMTDEEMHSLYNHDKIKAFMLFSHGEGYGLPIFEAAYSGIPVVTAGWSGQLDFLVDKGKKYFYDVDYDLAPIPDEAVWEGVLVKGSQWCFPREKSAKHMLRQCYKDFTGPQAQELREGCEAYAEHLKEKFDEQKLYAQFVNAILDKDASEDVSIDDIPKISLVTSVFKADDYIEQLMEDITRQTIFEEKCEWIILNVDPPGMEFDEEVILKYVEKYPNNIIYKRLEEDPGIYDTWNMGIKMATGDYVTNVNCDDRRAAYGLEKQAKMLVANPDVDLVYNDSYLMHEPNIMFEDVPSDSQRYNFEQFSKEAMLRGNLPHNNPMWKRELHDKYGYFNQYYKSAGDWDFWLRCSFGGAVFKKHPEILGVYYFNPEGMSTNPAHDSWKKEHEREIFTNYFQLYQASQGVVKFDSNQA